MRGLIPLLLLALAGCDAPEGDNAAVTDAANVAPATSSAEAEAIVREQAELADAAWTGRFAATPELCVQGVWDIKPHAIVTDGETACDVDNVARAAGQVTLRLSCLAEGTRSNEEWVLTPGAGDRLAIARDTGRETINVDLLRCR